MVFLAIYVVGANVLVPRLLTLDFGPVELVLTTGSVVWPFTVQISDMVNEIYGKKKAYLAAALSYLANVMFLSFVFMGLYATPLWDGAHEGFFMEYFSFAPRIAFASFVAYVLENWVNISIFAYLKERFRQNEMAQGVKGIVKFLVLRSATSDAASMVVDALVFTSIAFWGVLENSVLWSLILSSMAAKVILCQIDLPWLLLFRLMVRGVQREA
jgi:uncharacterized integral membrane protein (TIGR00697 family)